MAFFDWLSGDRPALVDEAFHDIVGMVSQGRAMFVSATGHLLENEILDDDLESMDHEINERERHLRAASLRYMSSSSPKQLVFVLKLLSVVHEAERIGDLAKKLSSTTDMAHSRRLGPWVLPLRDIRDDILDFFDLTLNAFENDDASLAEEVLSRHVHLKVDVAGYLGRLADSDSITANEGVVYALAARMLGRTSSHLANIASTVVFPFEQIRRTHLDPTGIDLSGRDLSDRDLSDPDFSDLNT